jgi:archaellum component FlaF (FlaF/FlaG flagellin family)
MKPSPLRDASLIKLNIKSDNKLVLCLDGGGTRGILTLQLLKKLEEIAGIPCYELFDMVSGTSTGGIIAGLIASSKTAVEIEDLYIKLVTKVFIKRSWSANRFLNPPLYDKKNYRNLLKTLIGDNTIEDVCAKSNLDIMITSKDMTGREETFFTCFNNGTSQKGTYRDVLLRGVMEATMSAPTYFMPLERFIDGGTTTYNNPTLAAIMEATCYDGKGKYSSDKLTVFSFGTGTTVQFIDPDETINPKGIDAYFWLNYVMDESSQDASDMQMDIIRSGLMQNLDFRRFQLSYDTTAIKQLPNRNISLIHEVEVDWLWDLTDADLKGIELDDVKKFPLLKAIGESMVDYMCPATGGNWVKQDLINAKKRDILVTAFGDTKRIHDQMSNTKWLDGFES